VPKVKKNETDTKKKPSSFLNFSSLSVRLCIDDFPALPAHPDHFGIFKALHLDTHGIYAFVTHQHYIGRMDRSLFVYNTPLSGLPPGLGVTLNKVHIFDDDTILVPKNFQNLAHLTLFLARNDFDFIVLLYAALCSCHTTPLTESG
jgi:hypothetical protein